MAREALVGKGEGWMGVRVKRWGGVAAWGDRFR